MRALIMAGGAGSRLNLGEKPLILINDLPMIRYVIDAFAGAGCSPVVATSPKTPMTLNWCRVNGIDTFVAGGVDYIRDMVEAVLALEEKQPLFVSVSDIPCIDRGIVQEIRNAYEKSGKDACSTWVPTRLVKACRGGISYRRTLGTLEACPTGLNILRGDLISEVQDELEYVIADSRLALNVNTRADRDAAEFFLKEHTE
ncbi:MAG: NTP transferase domain-containing protein [Methanoregula sp.]|nr:NTP transferase domain-containing protein [Methanoregula sp.]